MRGAPPLEQPDENDPTILAVVLTSLADHEQMFQVRIAGRAVRHTSPSHAVVTVVL